MQNIIANEIKTIPKTGIIATNAIKNRHIPNNIKQIMPNECIRNLINGEIILHGLFINELQKLFVGLFMLVTFAPKFTGCKFTTPNSILSNCVYVSSLSIKGEQSSLPKICCVFVVWVCVGICN